MNYHKIYNAFIEKFKNQMFQEGEYTEVHHILPRYAGGTDDSENLVELTYKQHVFVHKLWWKATGDIQAHSAYRLMSGLETNKKRELASMAGKLGGEVNRKSGHISSLGKSVGPVVGRKNVESGLLERVRPLANTPERQEKLRQLIQAMKVDGRLDKALKAAHAANRGSVWTEERKQEKSEKCKSYYTAPENKVKLSQMGKLGGAIKTENSKELSASILENAVREEQFLHKTDSRSKYKFISPEGLEFDSVSFMAKYYGCKSYILDNWAKREHHGWMRVLKTV
jgi:hypothetical protein